MDPLIVIVGETASGKSELAVRLAKKYNGEIICADSWTVYKGFDIGTAKPTPEAQNEVRHHMLDVADPLLGYNASIFKDTVVDVIEDIHSRGKLPILVGGTGLYIDAVVFSYKFLPKGDSQLRAELSTLSLEELLLRATNINLEGVDLRNKRRVIRAIESNGQKPQKSEIRSNTLIIGVKNDSKLSKDRVTRRVDAMIGAGLEQEVRALYEKYGWDIEPMKGIGYREWKEYFSGTQSLEITRQRIIKATLDLAKRQRTWFKRNPNIQWCDNFNKTESVLSTLTNTNLIQ